MKFAVAPILCMLAAGAASAAGEVLSDPTRPPGNIADAVTAGGEGGLRLQSVLSPQGGRPSAIINGQVVRIGEKVGEARLVRLSEVEAVLQGTNGIERLFLVPEVSKTSSQRKTAAMENDKRKKP